MIKIGIRNDLNMPLGKEISQCAHALCAYELGIYNKQEECFRIEEAELEKSLKEFSLEKMSEDDMKSALIVIQDAGHTVFNGVPTVTTCLFSTDLKGYQQNEHELSAPTETRMVLCVTKECRKKLKKEFFKLAVASYAQHLQKALKSSEPNQKKWMKAWTGGAFAKITLSASIDQIQGLTTENLPCAVTKIQEGMFVLGPAPKSELEPFTGMMRLL